MSNSFSQAVIANYKAALEEQKKAQAAADREAAKARRAAERERETKEQKLERQIKALRARIDKANKATDEVRTKYEVLQKASDRLYARAAAALREKGVENVNDILLG